MNVYKSVGKMRLMTNTNKQTKGKNEDQIFEVKRKEKGIIVL